ncbi:conserved hypothetical protein [Neospora caninum Liverpool]|uniref:Uncharacterized protein n=1 Tax=Neospora caninum (strain Liverpool) TaxID=572307 RepID=F0VEX8_NEOCL|nr:conserved hypothetical protein [Neospora caninum Liverpool]CBZ52272.1 conserved hypothetical protein [Neospora caninum Liverpool]CEL66240.1 TPA: hypothetical protein BN1204_020590 [Neospora caninum Liverpool]|eukprot:XP_003882304.1 conserved hypothetical protein [Neospora caninum Liverpool]
MTSVRPLVRFLVTCRLGLLGDAALAELTGFAQMERFDMRSTLVPSNSPIHPLHFQDAWQASEPMRVDIYYKVPVYGEGDLLDALTKANDKATLLSELQQQKERELETKEYLRSIAERKVDGIRRRLQIANKLRD